MTPELETALYGVVAAARAAVDWEGDLMRIVALRGALEAVDAAQRGEWAASPASTVSTLPPRPEGPAVPLGKITKTAAPPAPLQEEDRWKVVASIARTYPDALGVLRCSACGAAVAWDAEWGDYLCPSAHGRVET